jgi:hypothetical protein
MIHWSWRSGRFAVSVAVVFTMAGCSGVDSLRQPVSGFVTLDGQPLPSGWIVLYPTTRVDLEYIANSATLIKDGYFSIPREFGPIPGTYSVMIFGDNDLKSPPKDQNEPGKGRPVEKGHVPEKYNSKTMLAIEIKDFAIKDLTFHLNST